MDGSAERLRPEGVLVMASGAVNDAANVMDPTAINA